MNSPRPSPLRLGGLPGNAATRLLRSHLDLVALSLEAPLAAARWAPIPRIPGMPPGPARRAMAEALEGPFDLALHGFGLAQRLGIIECSLITSQKFHRALAALERLALGPWARR